VKPFWIAMSSLLCLVACGGTDVAVGGPADAVAGADGSNAGSAGGPEDPRAAAASYATDDIACTVDTDCCVAFDACFSRAYLVGSNDKDTVRALLDGASMAACTRCTNPPLQVACEDSKCVASIVEFPLDLVLPEAGVFLRLSKDHCGSVATAAPLGRRGSQFGCGG